MVEIGGQPILWHILKIYSSYGVRDFVICCGYKGYVIKEYFANYFLHMSDVTFDFTQNRMQVHHQKAEPWRLTLVDTGENTSTGGRLRRVAPYVQNEESFFFTYGDGVADVNVSAQLEFHRQHKRMATLLAVQPPGRFGALDMDGSDDSGFVEKPKGDGGWVNAGFFVLSPGVLNLINGDASVWEDQPLQSLARNGELAAYPHKGFWHPMDTLRDKLLLEQMWTTNTAPWKIW